MLSSPSLFPLFPPVQIMSRGHARRCFAELRDETAAGHAEANVASGFLILSDGRCFARRWWAHDAVLRAVADHADDSPPARELREWLLSLLPGPEDEEHVGYGPWFRKADQQLIERFLDLRELTPKNQRLFHQAARRAGERAQSAEGAGWPDWLRGGLVDLADMAARADRGEPPLSRSEWREVVPSEARRIGPGWNRT
jgi:hypothetical protein